MLSIITVAKGRLDTFQRSVDSIWKNCHDKYNIEHIVATDHDDDETNQFMGKYMIAYPQCNIFHRKVKFRDIEVYKQRNIHRDYWNPLALKAKGGVIFGLTNDAIIKTNHFDKILLDSLAHQKVRYRHSFFQILIDDDNDSLQPGSEKPFGFCGLIILSKGAVGLLQGIAPSEIVFSSADQYVDQLFANSLIPSQIDLRLHIKTESISHYTGKQETADDVTLSKPSLETDWKAVADRHYDLALDYAIMQQVKWVSWHMSTYERTVKAQDSPTHAAVIPSQAVLELVDYSSDGKGLFDYGANELPLPHPMRFDDPYIPKIIEED